MKKLERLLEKLTEIFTVEGMRIDEVLKVVAILVLMFLFEVASIWIAVVTHNYILLSMLTFAWIWIITEGFVNKIFFEKLNDYLLETPKATTLIFWVIFTIFMILSCNHFVGFILSTILAFMLGDFRKNKEKE